MLLAACLSAVLALPSPPPPHEPAALFARIGVVGASITAGFGLRQELGGLADLGDFVAGALVEPGEVRAFGDSLFFMDPVAKGTRELEKLARFEPTLVVGIDFLFWFSYGAGLSEEERVALFERGLALLEKLSVPLVVGDVPDMSAALEGVSELTGGPFLSPDMIPAAETRARLNARLKEWAAPREGVLILPLSELLRALHAGEKLRLGDDVVQVGSVRELLQSDLLHTTAQGSALLALAALRFVVAAREELDEALLTPDVAGVRARVSAPIEERSKQREQRRREREGDGDGGEADTLRRAAA